VKIAAGSCALALAVAASTIWAQPADDALEVIQLTAAPAVRLSSAALLVSEMSGGDLEVSRLVAALPAAGEKSPVLVLFAVDPATLAPGGGPLDLEIAAYALTAEGEVAAGTASDVYLAAAATRSGLQLALSLLLPVGDYRLRTLIRDPTSGALDLAGTDLRIPGPDQIRCAAWLQVSGASWTLAVPDPTTAAVLGSTRRVAATRPALTPGDTATVRLVRPAAGGNHDALAASIANGEGTLLATPRLTVELGALTTPDFEVSDAVFEVPDLAAGSYNLRLAPAGDPDRACADLGFVVRRQSRDEPLPPERATEAPAPLAVGSPSELKAVPGYADVLHTLAAGDVGQAGTELGALEAAIQRQEGDRGLLRFVRGEQAVIDRIARREPAALQALVLLYARLLGDYHGTEAKVLEADTVSTLETLARTLARHAEPGGPSRNAARALTVAASLLQRSGWHGASDRVYSFALALDETNAEARLGAAAGREKAEDYRGVVALLAPLANAGIETGAAVADEARLRLALNQIRIGNRVPGVEALQDLAARSDIRWISVLAFQELARLRAEPGGGATILRQGLARWPGERGMLVQLAHCLEGDDTPAAILELLRPLLADSPSEPSPRARYNSWPQPGATEPQGLEELSLWLAAEGGAR
jgi:hypothetical protein